MWRSSNSNSSFTLWPPDAAQQQKSPSFFCPTYADNNGFLSPNARHILPGFGAHGSSLHLNSTSNQQLNPPPLDPANVYLGERVTSLKDCLGTGCPTQLMKRFLIFDQSGDRTNLIFRSLINSQQASNPILPTTKEACAYVSDCCETEEHEDMHEDTEEIDALLYSDSENSYDSEEASTGHSPPGMEEVEETCSPVPAKRRKVERSELGTSLSDTASSAVVPSHHFVTDGSDDAEPSYGYSGSKLEDNPSNKVACCKHERIRTTVNLLRRIIPGGKGKDTAAVLDDAIRYLKSLKLQAEALGLHMD